jgi:putative peptidoglycan lipid II flippase
MNGAEKEPEDETAVEAQAGTEAEAEAPPAAQTGSAGSGTSERLARGARRVSGLTMLSRLLGLVREQVFALTLGAGAYSDAFLAAFRIPNLLRDLFAEGALSTAFVPTYVATLRNQSREAAYQLASRVMSTLTIYLGAIAALAMLFPAPVVHLVATGFSPEKAALTSTLVRIMMPFLPTISLAVVAMGALNAEERYTTPALASSMFNLVAIGGGVAVFVLAPSARAAVMVWAALTLVGGLAQLGIQVPPLARMGFRPKLLPDLKLRDPGTRRIATLMAPATLGVAAVQVNVVINSSFASLISDGAISWLSYAFRLMQLPIGVFGVAVGTTALTHLARDAAGGDLGALSGTLRRGLSMVLFLTVPSTVGLAILGEPIIRLIFQHGRFSPNATLQTAHALQGYAVGLVSYAAIKVVAPAFYALGRTRVPVTASLAAVAANVIWNVATFRTLGHVGLALGTSIAATVNLAVLVVAFQRRVHGLVSRELLGALARILAASAAMAAVVWPLARWLAPPPGKHLPLWAAQALVPVAVGAAVYFAAARLLRLPEARILVGRFRR